MNLGKSNHLNSTAVPVNDVDETAIANMLTLPILIVTMVMSLFLNILLARVLLASRKVLLATDILLLNIAGVDVCITLFLMPLSLVADEARGIRMLNPMSRECIAVGKLLYVLHLMDL